MPSTENRHALVRLVDSDADSGLGAARARNEGRKQRDRNGETTHKQLSNSAE
jgi:hypothetical protein